jgi:hypothetical protein
MKKAFLFLCLFAPMLAFSQVGKTYSVTLPEQTDHVDIFRFKTVKISFVQKSDFQYDVLFDFYNGKHYYESITRIPNESDVMVFTNKNHGRYEVACVSGTVVYFQNGFKARVYEN